MISKNRDINSTDEDVENRKVKRAAINRGNRRILPAMLTSMGQHMPSMPTFKIDRRPGKIKHHSDQECARRRGQLQHRNQVKIDAQTKRQPE